MNEHKQSNLVLYITLAIASIALIIGLIGLFKTNHTSTQQLQSQSTPPSASGSSTAPPPTDGVQTIDPSKTSGTAGSGQ